MKINGNRIETPNLEIIVLPRGSGKDIVFQAQSVLDYKDFDNLCPQPEPPVRFKPNGEKLIVSTDPDYVAKLNAWARNRTNFMVIRSLEATPGLEWETVKIDDPATWENYIKELEEAKLSQPEIGRIIDAVLSACGLNQAKIEKATQDFLAGMEEALSEPLSRNIEQNVSQSGEVVNVSELDHPA